MDLFEHARQEQIEKVAPLAARMRPRTLDEFAGQEHIVGPGRLLRRAIQADQMSSLIFYGPPGTGKTTLAAVIANTTRSHFETLNAVLAGVADIRRVTKEAQERRAQYGQRTIVFVDEVHRWNKAQQDALLPWVENGTIIMIGATTENPYFTVNRPLVSRSRIFSSSCWPSRTWPPSPAAPCPTRSAVMVTSRSTCTTTPWPTWWMWPTAMPVGCSTR